MAAAKYRAVDVDGVRIKADQKVLLFLAAANRAPRHWDEPDQFNIPRRATGHVGFGYGIHVCVGQQLARLEGEAVLKALAKRVTTIRLDGAPTKRVNNTLYGFDALPLALS